MTLRRLLLTCMTSAALALAAPAFGAGPLETARATARAAREQLTLVRSAQFSQRNELSQVSTRIEQLKGQRKGALAAGGELDLALKRSQDLSGSLSVLAQQAAARESELEAATVALLDGLTAELSALRTAFDRQPDRGARRELIAQMKTLRAEREALRATLPAARLPTLDTPRPSDDPAELLEQADLLRDNQEKLQTELKALDGRIAERRQEADLDRRVQRFLGEESMFDDQDRRLRVQRVEGAGQRAFDSAGGAAPGGLGATPSGATTGVDPAGLPGSAQVVNGSDARPQPGTSSALPGEDEDLPALERQRGALERLEQELGRRADELQRRAAALR
jgi:hypothetical protein